MLKKIFYPFILFLSVLHREILSARWYLSFLKNKPLYAGISTVSIGNLQMGGGGKTPLCLLMLKEMIKRKVNFVHSSRAYKSKVEKSGMIIALEENKVEDLDAVKVGDEPKLLMQSLKKGFFVLGKMRSKLLLQLSQQYFVKPQFDILTLEDAYQHFKLYRDYDFLLVDCTCPLKNFLLAPQGYLREPAENIWRADSIILSRWNLISDDHKDEWMKFIHSKKRKEAQVLFMNYSCEGIHSLDHSEKISTSELMSQKVVLFSGIANPKSFETLVHSLGAEVIKSYQFADHALISSSKMKVILDYATQNQAKVVCTEKDAVKLKEFSNSNSIYYVKLETEVLTLDGRPWNFLKDLNLEPRG